MNTKYLIAAIVFFTIGLGAAAQHHPQKARVVVGVRSGAITKKEAVKIHEERKEVRQEVQQAKADGIVTPGERKEIKQERREANKAIIRAKHNNAIRN